MVDAMLRHGLVVTGQHRQDYLAMTRAARQPGGIEVVQLKTGARGTIPEPPDLTAVLDAAPHQESLLLLTRADGQRWKVDHFNHAFAAGVKAAGLTGRTFHGLRKTVAAWLAEGGCSAAEIMAITGHRAVGEVTRYTAGADQKGRASSAMTVVAR